jgi:transcriptional regulator with XRE-family HTH domain
MPPTNDVESLLRRVRQAAGWSLRRAGEVFGVDHTQIHRWEHGANLDPIRYFITVAGASEAGRLAVQRAMGGGLQEFVFDEELGEEYRRCAELVYKHRSNPHVETMYQALLDTLELVERQVGGGTRGTTR